MKEQLHFPDDILYYLYLVMFKPYTLDRWIHTIAPSLSGKRNMEAIWSSRNEYPGLRSLLSLSLFHTYVTPILLVFISAFVASRVVKTENILEEQLLARNLVSSLLAVVFVLLILTLLSWTTVRLLAANVLLGLGIGIFSVISSFFYLPSDLSISTIPTNNLGYIIVNSLMFGIFFEIILDYAVVQREAFSIGCGSVLVIGCAFASASTTPLALLFIFLVFVAFFRIPIYILEGLWQIHLFRQLPAKGAEHTWKLSPIVWDEVILLPIPCLDLHLLKFVRENRAAGLKAIDQVATLTRQRWAAGNALRNILRDDLADSNSLLTIAATSTLLDKAVEYGLARDKFVLLRIREICELAKAAFESDSVFNHQEKNRLALESVRKVRADLSMSDRALHAQWDTGLETWERVFSSELKGLQDQYIVSNPYVAGAPLSDQSIVFKGRRDIFRALENEMNSAGSEYPTLLLFGGRRMGKTSVLKQLPTRLGPQIIPVNIDLQGASTVENVAGLMYLIARQISESALNYRHLSIPSLSLEALDDQPYIVFHRWIQRVEKLIREYRILLAFDEYESLGFMLDEKRVDERFFQLLRNLIQHHEKLVFIFSGTHTLGELNPIWSNYLINVEILKVGPLLQEDAIELITRPMAQFPLKYDHRSVSLLIKETGCHPRWLQTACREIVNIANAENRVEMTVEDVQRAVEIVPLRAEADFNDLWKGRDSNDIQRAVLLEIAGSPEGQCASSELVLRLGKSFSENDILRAVKYLLSRDILNKENQYNAVLLKRWVQKQI